MADDIDTIGICVLFEGFDAFSSGGSSDSSEPDVETGIDVLARRISAEKLGLQVEVHEHEDQDAAVGKVEKVLRDNPSAKVAVVGHSLGGDSAVEVSQTLGKKDIEVDLLVQIDSVGAFDEKKPANVKRGINIFSTSGDGIDGARQVEGSVNVGLEGTTHTDIDNDPRTHDIVVQELAKLVAS